VSEFAFELEVCAHLEGSREGILARQLGASVAESGGRILDIVHIEPGPEFDARTAITSAEIPLAAIDSSVGPGRARYWKRAFDCHPDRARRATERAREIGFFESERRNGREYVRQVARYPDWYGSITGIENKPDLGRPGDLKRQLRTDVSLGVLDYAILATESYVTRTHLHRLPDEMGVWRVHRLESDHTEGPPLEIEVIREPTRLSVENPGIEPLEYHPGRTDIAVVAPDAKAKQRRRIAERAYGKGWRTYDFPACETCEVDDATPSSLPHCPWAGRLVDASSECGPSCPGYETGTAAVDTATLREERDRYSPWVADPDGKQRRQSGLDQFG